MSPDQERGGPQSVKVNDIRYNLDDEWVTGTILGGAGKTTEKYKTWYNVGNEGNEERSVDPKPLNGRTYLNQK